MNIFKLGTCTTASLHWEKYIVKLVLFCTGLKHMHTRMKGLTLLMLFIGAYFSWWSVCLKCKGEGWGLQQTWTLMHTGVDRLRPQTAALMSSCFWRNMCSSNTVQFNVSSFKCFHILDLISDPSIYTAKWREMYVCPLRWLSIFRLICDEPIRKGVGQREREKHKSEGQTVSTVRRI